jgi:hypothetical protein
MKNGILSYITLVLLWIFPTVAFAQNPVIDDLIEQIVSKTGAENADFSTLVEDLNYYLNNPLNLNTASTEELEKLQLLDEMQIQSLHNYIQSVGQMQTIYELQLINGFSDKTIHDILPFVKVAPLGKQEKISMKQIVNRGKHLFLTETRFVIQTQKGYKNVPDSILIEKPNSVYQGDRFKFLNRYRFNYKDRVFAGITAEKDPGEPFTNYGFDFYSAHLQLNSFGVFKNITLGDYQVNFGQGLIAWSGFSLGKSSETQNIRKKAQGIRRYTSTNENLFMRGGGATVALGEFEITGFYSNKNIDANLTNTDTLTQEDLITTILNTGYHRTLAEIADKKVINEIVYGSNLTYKGKNYKLGASYIAYQYSKNIEQSNKPYKFFDFSGNNNANYSVDYQFFFQKFSFFGETGISQNGAMATINGLLLSVVPQLSFSVMQRYYQPDFQALYGSSFAEGSKNSNETGWYYGLTFHPIRNIQISAYADVYRFPWLRYGISAPSYGNDYLVQMDYHAGYDVNMYFRWKNESKMHNISGDYIGVRPLIKQQKQYFRYHISYRLNSHVSLRSRVEFSIYNADSTETGFMTYQDVNYNFHFPLSVNFRFAIFDAGYNARIYAYENDLLYNFSIPAYFNKGTRVYLMLKYKAADFLNIYLRYAHYYYADKNVIGSSLNEMEGNYISELKFQLKFRF